MCSSNPWVLFSCVGVAVECHLQLLERQVYLVPRLCPDQSFLSLCRQHNVAGWSMFYEVNLNSYHCLFGMLPSASTWVQHTQVATTALPLEFEVSWCRTPQICKMFPAGPGSNVKWPSLHWVWHWNTGWVQGGSQLLVASPSCVFSVFCGADACGVAKAIYKQLCFSHLGLCFWF